MNERNPYAPPTADVEPMVVPVAAPRLWNPGAAASWSLLLSPIFGAVLHMKNWEAMGEPEKAASARSWAIGSAAFFVVVTIVGYLLPASRAVDGFGRIGAFALLIAWYYANGKRQQSHVLAKFGQDYPRRGWSKPLLLALLAFVGYLAAVFVVVFVAQLVAGGT